MEKVLRCCLCFIPSLILILLAVNAAYAMDSAAFEKEPVLILSGIAGDQPGEFGVWRTGGEVWPKDFAIDKDHNIWVMDIMNRRIQKFDQEGRFLLEFPNDQNPSPVKLVASYIECDTKGNIVIETTPNDEFVIIDSNGRYLSTIKIPDLKRTEFDFSINYLDEIVYKVHGVTFVMDMNGEILKRGTDDGSDIDVTLLSTGVKDVRYKRILKVESSGSFFVRNLLDSNANSSAEPITYHEKDGRLITRLTDPDRLEDSFPYRYYSIDKEGNLYVMAIGLPVGAELEDNQYYGGTPFLYLYKWEQ